MDNSNMTNKPKLGDVVSLFYPSAYERYGVVIETDYHPAGIDDAVKIRFGGGINKSDEWWDLRYVQSRRAGIPLNEVK